jgi:predicted acyl esterase
MALAKGRLSQSTPVAGSAQLLPIPVTGLCSRSTNQWTAGVENQSPLPNPCLTDNTANDSLGVVFESAPMTTATAFQGPINAHLFASSTSGDGMLSVAVEDVAPNGKVARITGGWQVISLRKLDTSKSRFLDNKLIQPYHPFTKDSQALLTAGQIAPVDVEVFPTAARILPGHRLRIAIQTFDVPHLLPNGTLALGTAGIITLHTGGKYVSQVTVPALK